MIPKIATLPIPVTKIRVVYTELKEIAIPLHLMNDREAVRTYIEEHLNDSENVVASTWIVDHDSGPILGSYST